VCGGSASSGLTDILGEPVEQYLCGTSAQGWGRAGIDHAHERRDLVSGDVRRQSTAALRSRDDRSHELGVCAPASLAGAVAGVAEDVEEVEIGVVAARL
jgi:hypothetical protein